MARFGVHPHGSALAGHTPEPSLAAVPTFCFELLQSTLILNQPYDEAVELSDDGIDDSVDTHALSASSASHAGGDRERSGGGGAGRAAKASGGGGAGRAASPPPASAVAAGNLGMSGEYPSDTEGLAGVGLPSGTSAASAAAVSGAASSSGAARRDVGPSAAASTPAAPVSANSRGGGSLAATSAPTLGSAAELGSASSSSSAGAGVAGVGAPLSPGDSTGSPAGGAGGAAASNPGLIGIPPRKGAYNPADFAALRVHDDIRSLFEHIAAYKPRNVELDTRLRCFVPEYIPAVGEIDTFVKVRGGGHPCVRARARAAASP